MPGENEPTPTPQNPPAEATHGGGTAIAETETQAQNRAAIEGLYGNPGHEPQQPTQESPVPRAEAEDTSQLFNRVLASMNPNASPEQIAAHAANMSPEQRRAVINDILRRVAERAENTGEGMNWDDAADLDRLRPERGGVPISDEQRQEMQMRSRMYGDALSSQLMEALISKNFDQADAVIEGRLRAVEEDEQDVAGQQQNVQQLMHIVDSVFATKDEWRLELAEKLHARLQLHLGNFTSRYIGGEALSGVITNFQQRHWQSILRTAGVKRMIQFLEEKDETGAAGAYYRNAEADPDSQRYSKYKKFFNYDTLNDSDKASAKQKMWIMDRQLQLIKEARDSKNHLGFKYLKDYTENSELIQYALTKLEETDIGTSRSKNSFTVIQEMLREATDPESRISEILSQEDINRLKSFIFIQEVNPQTGQPLLDEQGNPKFKLDSEGNPIPSPQTNQGSFELNKLGQDFDWLMYELQRSLRLAARAHLTTTQANSYDGPHWKKGTHAPKQFKAGTIDVEILNPEAAQERAALIQLNPKLVFDFTHWSDPGWKVPDSVKDYIDPNTGKKGTVTVELGKDPHLLNLIPNLTDQEKLQRYGDLSPNATIRPNEQQIMQKKEDDAKIAAMKWLRSNKMQLIMITWEKAWRQLYKEYWDELDFAKAQSGISGRESRKTTHFPITLMKPGEDKPGKAIWLRKFTHTGAMSLDQLFAYESAINIFADWDSNFAKVKGYAARLKGGDQLRAKLTGGQKPDLLNSAEAVLKPEESLVEIKTHLKTYMSDSPEDEEEVDSIMRDWVQAIIEFNRHHSRELKLKPADLITSENHLRKLELNDIITEQVREEIANDVLGNPDYRAIVRHGKTLNFTGAFWAMIAKWAKGVATGKN